MKYFFLNIEYTMLKGIIYFVLVLNTCINNPCEHGATCLDLVNDFKCICALGYKGKFCEGINSCVEIISLTKLTSWWFSSLEFDYCNPNPCKNGGTCSGTGVNITCSCLPQYKGKRCEGMCVRFLFILKCLFYNTKDFL